LRIKLFMKHNHLVDENKIEDRRTIKKLNEGVDDIMELRDRKGKLFYR